MLVDAALSGYTLTSVVLTTGMAVQVTREFCAEVRPPSSLQDSACSLGLRSWHHAPCAESTQSVLTSCMIDAQACRKLG